MDPLQCAKELFDKFRAGTLDDYFAAEPITALRKVLCIIDAIAARFESGPVIGDSSVIDGDELEIEVQAFANALCESENGSIGESGVLSPLTLQVLLMLAEKLLERLLKSRS